LVIDKISDRLLAEQSYDFNSIPPKGEIVYLQEKVILDLGADLIEVSREIHPDNAELFREITTLFGVKLVGIDFIAEDITKSWKKQQCAIIELNSLPYIDMHHFPTIGEPMKISKHLCDMVFKYY
jgi:cyanophycin synthetase